MCFQMSLRLRFGCTRYLCCHVFVVEAMVDVVTEFAREGALRKFLSAVDYQRKKGRLKRTWKNRIEGECVKVGLRRDEEPCRSTWSVGVNLIAVGLR